MNTKTQIKIIAIILTYITAIDYITLHKIKRLQTIINYGLTTIELLTIQEAITQLQKAIP